MNHRARACRALGVLALLATSQTGSAQDDGIGVDSILFGQSAAFSGPAGELGRQLRAGIVAAFEDANAAGGIHGRKLALLSIDDNYEPDLTIANTRRLIEQERVFALIGGAGTPTARAAAPIALEAGVPLIAPYTGAELIRAAGDWPNIVNLRASYYQETEEVVERLITDLNIRRIGVLHQEDSYGTAGLVGVQRALNKRGLALAGVATYRRNTTAVKTAILELQKAQAGALIVIGAYRPVAATVAWARQIGFQPMVVTISFSGGNALAAELTRLGVGDVFVSQVVPFPASGTRIASSYRRALARHARGVKPGFVSFEGYLAGRLAIVGLERSGATVDRSRFLDSILRGDPISLDGFRLRYGESDNQGSNEVYLTVIDDAGNYKPIVLLGDAFE